MKLAVTAIFSLVFFLTSLVWGQTEKKIYDSWVSWKNPFIIAKEQGNHSFRDNADWTVLHDAMRYEFSTIEDIQWWVKKGADIHARIRYPKLSPGDPPGWVFLSQDKKINRGGDDSICEKWFAFRGWQPIHAAAYYNRLDGAELLLKLGADPNSMAHEYG